MVLARLGGELAEHLRVPHVGRDRQDLGEPRRTSSAFTMTSPPSARLTQT